MPSQPRPSAWRKGRSCSRHLQGDRPGRVPSSLKVTHVRAAASWDQVGEKPVLLRGSQGIM